MWVVNSILTKLAWARDSGGGSSGVACSLDYKELDVVELEEVMLGVSTTFAVFSWGQEEEEGSPGDIADGFLTWCTGCMVVSKAWTTFTGGGGYYHGRSRVCFLVGRELLAQTKVELSRPVVPVVVDSHRGKDLAEGA